MGVPIRDSWRRVVSIAALLTLAVSLPAPSQETTPAGENAPAAAPPAVPADPNSNNSAPVTPDGAAGAPAVPVPVTAPPPPPPLELVPYRVRLELVLDLGADDSAANRSRLREEIRGMIAGQVGAFWDVEIPDEAAGWLASPADVTRRQLADFDQFKESGEDKIVLAGIDRIGGETTVNVREWDAATRTLGLLQTRRTTDSRATSSLVLEALRAAFRPLVQIDQTKDGAVTLRGKSNLIPPHDPAWNPLREGMVFEPYYRYLNKERKVERITRVPWTYLVSGPPVPDEGRAPGIPISGLRTAISARRRRIEAVALGVPVADSPTTVKLATRPPTKRSIVGVEVHVRKERFVPQVPEGETPPPPLTILVSDRRGEITIPAKLAPSGTPLWLFVYSGSQMLGRVPFVPGVRPRDELELADDTLRLQVEGEIALLQARLVDLAAQRAVMMAMVRKRADEKDFAGADTLLKKVDESVKPPVLLADLNTIRSPALKSAREQRDKATEARVKKICDDTAEIITVHFSDEKIAELREEIGELKQIAADEAAGIEPRPKKDRPKKTSTKTKKKAAAADQPPADVPRGS